MYVTVPGDKSISQRALILASLADGESRIQGLLTGADARSTAGVMRRLGAAVSELDDATGSVRVQGRGLRGLRPNDGTLDCGNSGTCARLLLGVLAGQEGRSTVTGDESLRRRPMQRVTAPLRQMGASIEDLGDPGRLPLRIQGGRLAPLRYTSPVASAQVKSALLLAGLASGVDVEVVEPHQSRDHTECMLEQVGARVAAGLHAGRWRVTLTDPPGFIEPLDLRVPGDFSSAAFLLVLAVLGGGGGEITVRRVGLNPTRTGLLEVLTRMGADLEVSTEVEGMPGESEGSVTARPSSLRGTEVMEREVPALIDEIPVLAIAAARAAGTSRISGAGELRVKETDRIHALVENLRNLGVYARPLPDGLEIEGTDRPLIGPVRTFGDHRMAMAFGVLGALPGNSVRIDDRTISEVSFPGFWNVLERVAGR